jgi:hypothetical protein
MSFCTNGRRRVQPRPYRRTPRRPGAFGAGIPSPDPRNLSDLSEGERKVLDELAGDWLPRDAILDGSIDPAFWGAWADEFAFVPSVEDAAWAASELNKAACDYDVAEHQPGPRRDAVRASMINPNLARALANGSIPLD